MIGKVYGGVVEARIESRIESRLRTLDNRASIFGLRASLPAGGDTSIVTVKQYLP